MYKLNFKKRGWIVKQVLKGVPKVDVALSQRVSDRAVRGIMRVHADFGWDDLKA